MLHKALQDCQQHKAFTESRAADLSCWVVVRPAPTPKKQLLLISSPQGQECCPKQHTQHEPAAVAPEQNQNPSLCCLAALIACVLVFLEGRWDTPGWRAKDTNANKQNQSSRELP